MKEAAKTSKNQKVQQFLDELMLIDPERYEILKEVRNCVLTYQSGVEEKFMYGGIVFYSNSEMISGVFAFKNHVTIEFSLGFQMKDPNKLLEGSGKFRRHLKFKSQAAIKEKQLSFYIKQAVNIDG